jgi:surface antigen
MRRPLAILALAGCLALPQAASAQSATTLGVGSGAVAGALVGGPIGAVAGAVIGGVIGNSNEGRGRRSVRRTRRVAAIRRAPQRRAEADLPRVAAPVAAAGTTWKDPR